MTLDRRTQPAPISRARPPAKKKVEDFRLTGKHVRAIEAQGDLVLHEGGFGEITLVFERGRIARLTTTTSAKYEDDGNHNGNGNGNGEHDHNGNGNGEHKESSYSQGSDRSDVSNGWTEDRVPHERTRRRTKSGR